VVPIASPKEDIVNKSRTLFVGTVLIGLLAGSAVSAAAQESERAAPVEVTGTGIGGDCPVENTTEVVDGIAYERGGYCNPIWEMSDPRLDGTVTWAWSGGQDLSGPGGLTFGYVANSIENDARAWRGRPVAAVEFVDGAEYVEHIILDREGDYEGLIAVLVIDRGSIQGFIIDGEFPSPPEIASPK
jgi:hypothetical protein